MLKKEERIRQYLEGTIQALCLFMTRRNGSLGALATTCSGTHEVCRGL